jgi:hypothetical protein
MLDNLKKLVSKTNSKRRLKGEKEEAYSIVIVSCDGFLIIAYDGAGG